MGAVVPEAFLPARHPVLWVGFIVITSLVSSGFTVTRGR
jgi:hypothetical protein